MDKFFKQFDKDILNFYGKMVVSLNKNHNETPNNQSKNCMSIEEYTVRAVWYSKVVVHHQATFDMQKDFYQYGLKFINGGK